MTFAAAIIELAAKPARRSVVIGVREPIRATRYTIKTAATAPAKAATGTRAKPTAPPPTPGAGVRRLPRALHRSTFRADTDQPGGCGAGPGTGHQPPTAPLNDAAPSTRGNGAAHDRVFSLRPGAPAETPNTCRSTMDAMSPGGIDTVPSDAATSSATTSTPIIKPNTRPACAAASILDGDRTCTVLANQIANILSTAAQIDGDCISRHPHVHEPQTGTLQAAVDQFIELVFTLGV